MRQDTRDSWKGPNVQRTPPRLRHIVVGQNRWFVDTLIVDSRRTGEKNNSARDLSTGPGTTPKRGNPDLRSTFSWLGSEIRSFSVGRRSEPKQTIKAFQSNRAGSTSRHTVQVMALPHLGGNCGHSPLRGSLSQGRISSSLIDNLLKSRTIRVVFVSCVGS